MSRCPHGCYTLSSARARPTKPAALGRAEKRRRTPEGASPPRSAPPAAGAGIALPVPCRAPRTPRRSVAAKGAAGPRVETQPADGLRAPSLPGRALLASARPRAPSGRGRERPGSRKRNEVDRSPARAGRAPRISPPGPGAHRPLPPACSTDPAPGAERPRVRIAEFPEALAGVPSGASASAAG